jgi:hypothetical protein
VKILYIHIYIYLAYMCVYTHVASSEIFRLNVPMCAVNLCHSLKKLRFLPGYGRKIHLLALSPIHVSWIFLPRLLLEKHSALGCPHTQEQVHIISEASPLPRWSYQSQTATLDKARGQGSVSFPFLSHLVQTGTPGQWVISNY